MSLVKKSIFFGTAFPYLKKNQNKPQHKDKKWLLFVSQCTEHGYFAEEENIYQQMKHRQAKENRILFIFHEQKKKKKRLVVYKVKDLYKVPSCNNSHKAKIASGSREKTQE